MNNRCDQERGPDDSGETPELAIAAVRAALEQMNLSYDFLPECDGFVVPLSSPDIDLKSRIVCGSDRLMHFVARHPALVPPHRRGAVLQCLNSINLRLQCGLFTLDASGRVDFRIGVIFQAAAPSYDEIETYFLVCVQTMFNAAPHLTGLFFGNTFPEAVAIAVFSSNNAPEYPEIQPVPDQVRPDLN